MEEKYKYFAFISYNSKDTAWGKRLQRRLEHFKMPTAVCKSHGWERRPIKPVFFAPTDIQPGGLNDELKKRLRESKNLIVICSPNSAKSEWVGREIEYFNSLGRADNIHFFIVDGIPHSGDPATECFNPVVDRLDIPEILGANVHEKVFRQPWLNRERAYIQLITKLLGVEFDSVWQRHRRAMIRSVILWSVALVAVIASFVSVRLATLPFDATFNVTPVADNASLPPLADAVVTLRLDNEVKTDTIVSAADEAVFKNIPRRFLGREVSVSVAARGFLPMDTTLVLDKDIALPLRRDESVYGGIRCRLWNGDTEQYMSGVKVNVAGHEAVSDSDGYITLQIPLEEQQTAYPVTAGVNLLDEYITMPCTSSTVILVQ